MRAQTILSTLNSLCFTDFTGPQGSLNECLWYWVWNVKPYDLAPLVLHLSFTHSSTYLSFLCISLPWGQVTERDWLLEVQWEPIRSPGSNLLCLPWFLPLHSLECDLSEQSCTKTQYLWIPCKAIGVNNKSHTATVAGTSKAALTAGRGNFLWTIFM